MGGWGVFALPTIERAGQKGAKKPKFCSEKGVQWGKGPENNVKNPRGDTHGGGCRRNPKFLGGGLKAPIACPPKGDKTAV